MIRMARISILMGIYNCASTLQDALDSLYAQTYKDFKIILCDDGSKDATLRIAQDNARLHDNVIVIKNERNMGLNYTLNHCLKYADTEYVARMDGDDISMPTRFEKEIKFLDEHPEYAVVSAPMVYFDENGDFSGAAIVELGPEYVLIRRISFLPSERSGKNVYAFLTALHQKYANRRLMGTMATQPLITNWEKMHEKQ